MTYIWFIVMLILIYIEIITPAIASIWFVVSAFLTMLVSFFVPNIFIQVSIFLFGGTLFYLSTIKLINKILYSGEKVGDTIDRFVGKKGVVSQPIEKDIIGEVTIDGKIWKAVAKEKIVISEIVEIVSISDNVLTVKKDF